MWPSRVTQLGNCTAFKLNYLNKGTENGVPFIPQILLIRRKRNLNENCIPVHSGGSVMRVPWTIHLGQSQHLPQAG